MESSFISDSLYRSQGASRRKLINIHISLISMTVFVSCVRWRIILNALRAQRRVKRERNKELIKSTKIV